MYLLDSRMCSQQGECPSAVDPGSSPRVSLCFVEVAEFLQSRGYLAELFSALTFLSSRAVTWL